MRRSEPKPSQHEITDEVRYRSPDCVDPDSEEAAPTLVSHDSALNVAHERPSKRTKPACAGPLRYAC